MYQQTMLDTLDDTALATAFNLVYADYMVPVNVDGAWIRQHVTRCDIALEHSPLWLNDDGAVVGLALLGVRGERGWLGGFGIAPAYRGKSISRTLCEAVLRSARHVGLNEIQLEVITSNAKAIRTYEQAGFAHHRDLLILTRPPGTVTLDVDTTAAVEADPTELMRSRLTMATAAPPWQYEPASYAGAPDLRGLVVGDPTAPLAMCLFRASTTGARIADVAALDVISAQTVLAGLIERIPDQSLTITNLPDGSEALPAFFATGWVESMRQHEMLVHL